jgi:hypothetical protein
MSLDCIDGVPTASPGEIPSGNRRAGARIADFASRRKAMPAALVSSLFLQNNLLRKPLPSDRIKKSGQWKTSIGMAHWERKQISRRTTEALAAAKARGVKLGNYARISKAKMAATRARAETVRPAIEATAHLSANAAAADLNERGVTTAAGGSWRAEQVLRARRHLGI